MSLTPGTRLGQYELLERLGTGGMGSVYRAHDSKLQRTVAIKILSAQDDEASARLLQEARPASALNHPNICTIHEVGEHPSAVSGQAGQAFIVMEHVEGKPLSELIPPDGLPAETVINYATQIADALSHAHERGVVHRDLKGQNVVITPEGRAKVLDFGLATKLPRGDSDEVTQTQGALDPGGVLAGTLAYMAPEVLRGETATARTDIWALGVLIYEMGSGRLPFTGSTVAETAASILKESTTPLPAHVPQGLRTVTQRSLSKDSSQRYATTGELRAVLEAIASSDSDSAASSDTRPATTASIAVLPFADMSPQKDQDYFCDGIAEEIINALSGIDGLRVAARTSSFKFKGQAVDATEVGAKLKVDSVLEGSVRKAGDRLRITAQLVNAADGFHLWSDRYDRTMDDIFAVQDDIARSIARRLDVTLGGRTEPGGMPPTGNMNAYNALLHGRFLLRQREPVAMKQALVQFEHALSLDPKYAAAHAAVADANALMSDQGVIEPIVAMPAVRQAAARALELDPALVEPHVTLGWQEMAHGWNRISAERHFEQALELGPDSADVHSRYACYLAWIPARFDEAVTEARRGAELDPLNASSHIWLGLALWFAGQFEESVVAQGHAIELDRTSWHAHHSIGQAYLAWKRYPDAIDAYTAAIQIGGRHPWSVIDMGIAHARSGNRTEALALHEECVVRSRVEFGAPALLACLCGELGFIDQAFEFLERGYEVRDTWMMFLHHPNFLFFDSLRNDPRFADLRQRVGMG